MNHMWLTLWPWTLYSLWPWWRRWVIVRVIFTCDGSQPMCCSTQWRNFRTKLRTRCTVTPLAQVLRQNATLIATLLLTVAAAAYPRPGKAAYHVLSEPLIVILFACLGLTLRLKELRQGLVAFRIHASIQAFSLLFTPLAIYATCYISGLARLTLGSKWLARGLMVTACLPAPTNTHVMFTMQCGGDESVAAINAALGNIMGAVVSPLTTALTLGGGASSSMAHLGYTFLVVLKRILAPLICGILLQVTLPNAVASVHSKVRTISAAVLLIFLYLIFCSAFAQGSGVRPQSIARLCAVIVILHLIIFTSAWYVSAVVADTRERRVAFVFTASHKTESLGVAIIATLFKHRHIGALTLPIVVYHTVQMIVAGSTTPKLTAWLDADCAAAGASATSPSADNPGLLQNPFLGDDTEGEGSGTAPEEVAAARAKPFHFTSEQSRSYSCGPPAADVPNTWV